MNNNDTVSAARKQSIGELYIECLESKVALFEIALHLACKTMAIKCGDDPDAIEIEADRWQSHFLHRARGERVKSGSL